MLSQNGTTHKSRRKMKKGRRQGRRGGHYYTAVSLLRSRLRLVQVDLCTTQVSCCHVPCVMPVTMWSTYITVDFFFHLFTLSLTCFPSFFHGCFTDYKNTFEIINEPDYTVALIINADVGTLLSKDWFKWACKWGLTRVNC